MRIAVGADHLGRELKDLIRDHLEQAGHDVNDLGCAAGAEVDYPDVAAAVAILVSSGDVERAVLVCGTGIGMSIAANKVNGVRAAVASDPYSAERASASNDAQVLCLGSQVIGQSVAPMLVDVWMNATFNQQRSGRKVDKITNIELGRT